MIIENYACMIYSYQLSLFLPGLIEVFFCGDGALIELREVISLQSLGFFKVFNRFSVVLTGCVDESEVVLHGNDLFKEAVDR